MAGWYNSRTGPPTAPHRKQQEPKAEEKEVSYLRAAAAPPASTDKDTEVKLEIKEKPSKANGTAGSGNGCVKSCFGLKRGNS